MGNLSYIHPELRGLAIEVSKLTLDPKNARKHDRRNLDAIKASLVKFGMRQPIVVQRAGDALIVRAGNGRLQVAKELGWSHLPAVVFDENDDEAIAYAIADNRTAELAEWDWDVLTEHLLTQQEMGQDLEMLGFDSEMLSEIGVNIEKSPRVEIVEDEIPEPPGDPITKPGDLWLLGDHRLLCGDSTKAEDVERLMAGAKADLCLTDPPYGADIQYATHNDTQDALIKLIKGFFPLARKYAALIGLTPGINNVFLYEKPDWMLCWFYAAGTGRTPWGFSAWQPVIVWGKDPKLANGEGAHPDGYNWPMSKADAEERKTIAHACPKPVSSWAKWIERLSNEKTQTLYDPFCGSGTTLIAAEQLGRKCYGMEISPRYCDVIVGRWEKLTGKTAVRG